MIAKTLLALLAASVTAALPKGEAQGESLPTSSAFPLAPSPLAAGQEILVIQEVDSTPTTEDVTPTGTIALTKFTTTQTCVTECISFTNDCGVSYGGCYIDCTGGKEVPAFEAPSCPAEVKEEAKEEAKEN